MMEPQILDIAKTQGESLVERNGVASEIVWKLLVSHIDPIGKLLPNAVNLTMPAVILPASAESTVTFGLAR